MLSPQYITDPRYWTVRHIGRIDLKKVPYHAPTAARNNTDKQTA